MADNWDDILAEPIASLADPTAFAASDGETDVEETGGGWLAVHALSDISPRPQEAPMTLPAIDGMLQIRLPVQEETQQASTKLPPSLADQLSLTWAARRRSVPEAEPEPEPASTPRPVARRVEAPVTVEAPKPAPTWRKPFEAVARVFTRQPQPEPAPAPMHDEAPAAPASAPQPRTVLAIAEPSATDELQTPLAVVQDVPLTLAAPQRHNDAPETVEPSPAPQAATNQPQRTVTTPAREDVPLSQTPVVRAARLEAPATPNAPVRRGAESEALATQSNAIPATSASVPAATPSLAPRRGLLAWLLPRRATEAPQASAPVLQPAPRTVVTPPPARVESQRRENAEAVAAPQLSSEPTLAQALPALRQTQPSSIQPDDTYEPALSPEALQDLPPQVALTHLLRNTHDDAPAEADAETVRQTLARLVEAAPVTEPARLDTTDDAGETLPAQLQARLEGLLDVPLHEVRIFRGQVSQRLTERMQADAVTIGNQVHVATGEGNPALPSGRALLAHEVTHYAVHRVESAGPAATLSGAPTDAGQPAWPQFPGIAPEPGTPTADAEETLALRVEHAMSRPDAFDAPFSAPGMQTGNAAPLSLQHRAQPAPVVFAPGGIPATAFGAPGGFNAGGFGGFSAGSIGGGGFGAGGMSNGGGVGMAPWDRMDEAADFLSSASDMASSAMDTAQDVQETAEDFEDNDEMIEKVAEAVIKHMENKDKFERERRGAFDGSLGG